MVVRVAAESGWMVLLEAYRQMRRPPSLEFHSAAELVDLERRLIREDSKRYLEARTRAAAGGTVLADTGFLGPLTYTWALVGIGAAPPSALTAVVQFARELSERGEWGLADAYVYLDTPTSIRSDRVRRDPAGHPADLARRHERVGGLERRFYLERFAPLLGTRFHSASGSGSVSQVGTRVRKAARTPAGASPEVGPISPVLALFDAPAGGARSARGKC
jgi:hypothetical protein